jgi:hypothetical protein
MTIIRAISPPTTESRIMIKVTLASVSDHQTREVMGEPTPIPGVFLTPKINPDGGYHGCWNLTHAGTGWAVTPYAYFDPEDCRELARRLAAVHDWSTLDPDPRAWPSEFNTAVAAVLAVHWNEVRVAELEEAGYFSGRMVS